MTMLIDRTGMSRFDETTLSHGRMYSSLATPGPVLLFVHGGYHGAWCWQKFMHWFGERGQATAAVDLRGHGGLVQTGDFHQQGVADFASDVSEAARELDRPVIMVGHSLGGLVGMLAAREVAPVAQILLAPSPPGQLEGLTPLPAYPEDRPVMPPEAMAARTKFLAHYDGEIDSFMSCLCAESPRAMNDRYRLRVQVDPGWIKGPTFCLSAGRDQKHLHPPGQDEAVARFFGGAHMIRPDAAHDMMLDDQWQETAWLLLDWLRRQELGQTGVGAA
jgi:pimeloyl-ACP methyl ester carboxylesterase